MQGAQDTSFYLRHLNKHPRKGATGMWVSQAEAIASAMEMKQESTCSPHPV